MWDVSRVLFEAGPLELRWYSLLFAVGIVLAYLVERWVFRGEGWKMDDLDSVVVYLFIGLVVGARLGEVFFYHPDYYLSHPAEILKVWKGGLASHGATIGLLVSYLLFLAVRGWRAGHGVVAGVRRDFWKYVDGIAIGMPLVAGFVRLGNFFNSEIVGRATGSDFGVVFVRNGEDFARHPVQLYEMLLAWSVFALMFLMWKKKRDRREAGKASGLIGKKGFFVFFFIGTYFAGRFALEFFKEYQVLPGSGGWAMGLTMGQVLSVVPVLIALGWFGWQFFRKK